MSEARDSMFQFALILASRAFLACGTGVDADHRESVEPAPAPVPFVPDACKRSMNDGTTAQVTIGEGRDTYRDLADGETLVWEKGRQGAHHLWISLRTRGLRAHLTKATVDLFDIDALSSPKLLVHDMVSVPLTPTDGRHCLLKALRMPIDIIVPLPKLLHHRIRIEAKVTDRDGSQATATKVIVAAGQLD